MEEPSEVRSADESRLISNLKADSVHSDKVNVHAVLQSDRGPLQLSHWIIFMLTALCCSWHTFSPAFLVPVSECISFERDPSNASSSSSSLSTENVMNSTSSFMANSIQRSCFTKWMTNNCSGRNYSGKSVNDHQIIIKCTPQNDETSDIPHEKLAFHGTKYLIAIAKATYMLGCFGAAILVHPMVNRFGRRRTISFCFVLFYVCSICTFLTDSMCVFITLRFFLSMGLTSVYWITFSAMLKSIVPDYRLLYGVIGHLGWSIGYMTLPVISWFTIDWFSFQACISIPCLLLIMPLCFLPESVNYHLRKGKVKEAISTLKASLKRNSQNSDDITEICHQAHQNLIKRSREPDKSLFLRLKGHLGYRNLLFYAFSFMMSLLYYILSWDFCLLPGDPFVNFAWAGAMEILAVLLLIFFGYIVSSNLLLFLMAMGASIFPLAGVLVATGEIWVPLHSYFAAKFFVTGAVILTVIRGFEESCFVIVGAVTSIGAAVAPFLDKMVVDGYCPMLLLTVVSMASLILGILSALLPIKPQKCSLQNRL